MKNKIAKTSLIDTYNLIKTGEPVNLKGIKPDFITDCFKYGWLKTKPSKAHKKWWFECFECDYPEYIEDIPNDVIKELKEFIKHRKKDEAQEEKWKMQRYKRGYSDCDCWNINSWFLDIMPKMLQQMRDNLSGFPSDITSILMPNNKAISDTVLDENAQEEPGFIKWKETLDRMIFLLGEMNEDKCSFENPYEKEHEKMNRDFREKYGWFGEGLKSEEEKAEEEEKGSCRMYFPQDFPELYPEATELNHKWSMHEQYKQQYMDKCREEFFNLFSKNFWNLWD